MQAALSLPAEGVNMQANRSATSTLYSNLKFLRYDDWLNALGQSFLLKSRGKNIALHEVLSIDPDHGAFV